MGDIKFKDVSDKLNRIKIKKVKYSTNQSGYAKKSIGKALKR